MPSVTFLGTRFDNLRIAGHKVEVERNLDILGPKPARDKSYFDDPGVLGRVGQARGRTGVGRRPWLTAVRTL